MSYMFEDTAEPSELERLRAIEASFDPQTRRHLEAAGIAPGHHALEIGAGAGSIARWMRDRVGPDGRVVEVDSNARFLRELRPSVEVMETDIATAALPAAAFDIVHARYVLIHNVGARSILDIMVRSTKPGGWLLLEEPDFSGCRSLAGRGELRRSCDRVNDAVLAMFAGRGLDPSVGRRLPEQVQDCGLELVAVECESGIAPGGSALTQMMSLTARHLADRYPETGCATVDDVAHYREFLADPACWGTYFAIVRVLARAPDPAASASWPAR